MLSLTKVNDYIYKDENGNEYTLAQKSSGEKILCKVYPNGSLLQIVKKYILKDKL